MQDLLEKLRVYGVGKRKLDDILFVDEFPPKVLGVYDVEEEELCYEIITSTCSIPGCKYKTDSLLDYENHYNSRHRYSCGECKKILPSPHLLDLHLQETHDSFFAVCALRKPSYCCYIEDCKEKFLTPDERMDHCVKVHKIPKDFRFDQKPKKKKNKSDAMEVDREKKFTFCNSKSKSFKYSGKKFTKDTKTESSVDIDMVVNSLRENLPE